MARSTMAGRRKLFKQGASMSNEPTGRVQPIPEHLHTVTPRLVVRDGDGAIDFYRAAFGAQELGERFTGPGGELIHAELRIGDAVVMVTQEADNGAPARSPKSLGGSVTAIMATYWEDVDAAWARATSAGAEVLYPLEDQFYGERGGRVRDPFGQQWMLSQRIEVVSREEMERRAARFFAGE
jgi:PhnB protein